MRRFWAVFKKEFRQVRRDPLSLGMLVLVPALLLVMYGYALSFDVKHVAMAVLDQDGTEASRAFLDSLFQNPYFDRKDTLSRAAEADDLLNREKVRAVLIVPRGFGERIASGRDVRVQVLVDGANANSASTTIGYIEILADRQTRQWSQAALSRTGATTPLPRVTLEPRIWFNAELNSAKFLVPGLIGMLLMLAAVVATALSIVREKERETMEQMMVSSLRPAELILGKTLPYVIICLVTMVMILLLGNLLFGVVVRGSWALLGLVTLAFLFAALGMGVLISSITRSQQVAFQVAVVATMLPSIILSGLIFPIQNMPLPIQAISCLVIPRYFVSALREIILKGAPLGTVWPELGMLLALGLVFNLLAAHQTRKSI